MAQIPVKKSLADKLKAVSESGLASLAPTEKKKKEVERAPEIREVIANAARRLKVVRLVDLISAYGDEERKIKEKKAPLVSQLKSLLTEDEGLVTTKFEVDGRRVNLYAVKRQKISVPKLLAHNILPSVIAECTDVTESYNLRISAVGEEEEDE